MFGLIRYMEQYTPFGAQRYKKLGFRHHIYQKKNLPLLQFITAISYLYQSIRRFFRVHCPKPYLIERHLPMLASCSLKTEGYLLAGNLVFRE